MLRESNVHTLTWADKTMSVLRERQLEACEHRLARLPAFGLFQGCNDVNVEELWQCSFEAQEKPVQTVLHTASMLKAQVLTRLPMEAALLSVEEHMLAERLIVLEGTAELMDWEEVSGAEALVRRLWCTLSRRDDRIVIHMPRTILVPLMAVFASPMHAEIREKLLRYETAIHGLLYIGGLLHYQEPLMLLRRDVLQNTYADDETLALRYLRNTFDYTYDQQGDMLLLHPGLAEPERMLRQTIAMPQTAFELDEDMLVGAMDGLLPEERPLFDGMYGPLIGAVRPEITEEDAVEDLRMLAKQGVSLQEMHEVLASMLTIQPTEAMLSGLRQLHRHTPRWGTLQAATVQ